MFAMVDVQVQDKKRTRARWRAVDMCARRERADVGLTSSPGSPALGLLVTKGGDRSGLRSKSTAGGWDPRRNFVWVT